jgi:hypothetical protein
MTYRREVTSRSDEPEPDAGVAPAELSDGDLDRELAHLHETRRETFLHGSESAFENHTRRMLALEREFLRRFPAESSPDPLRTRSGARHAAGLAR